MSVSALNEMQAAMTGALWLARGDRRGLGFFDASIDGFWRSFRAAIVCYPLYLILVNIRVNAPQWAEAGVARILLAETISYVIVWVAFPLVILQLSRVIDREERFLAFMVTYNWSQIPQTALVTIVALNRAGGLFPLPLAAFVELAAAIAVLVYKWYIARVALSVTGGQAALVVILDLMLGVLVGSIALGLYYTGGS
jgi:hypothetical protein